MRLAKWVGWVGKTGVKWVVKEPRPNHYIETGPEGLRGVFEGFGGWEWPTILPNTCCFLIHTHTHPENFLRSLFLAANKKYIYIYIYVQLVAFGHPSPSSPLHYNASLSLLYIPDFFPLFIWVCSFLFFYFVNKGKGKVWLFNMFTPHRGRGKRGGGGEGEVSFPGKQTN